MGSGMTGVVVVAAPGFMPGVIHAGASGGFAKTPGQSGLRRRAPAGFPLTTRERREGHGNEPDGGDKSSGAGAAGRPAPRAGNAACLRMLAMKIDYCE